MAGLAPGVKKLRGGARERSLSFIFVLIAAESSVLVNPHRQFSTFVGIWRVGPSLRAAESGRGRAAEFGSRCGEREGSRSVQAIRSCFCRNRGRRASTCHANATTVLRSLYSTQQCNDRVNLRVQTDMAALSGGAGAGMSGARQGNVRNSKAWPKHRAEIPALRARGLADRMRAAC